MCKKLLFLYLQFLYIYKTTLDLHFKVLLFPRRKDQFCCEVGHFWGKKKCLQYRIQLIFHFVHIMRISSSLSRIEIKFGLNTITQTCVLVAQSCLALCDPMDCSPAKLLCPWNSPGKNIGVGCHFLLQEIFPTQGSNLGLPYCRQMLYHLSHQGSQ